MHGVILLENKMADALYAIEPKETMLHKNKRAVDDKIEISSQSIININGAYELEDVYLEQIGYEYPKESSLSFG